MDHQKQHLHRCSEATATDKQYCTCRSSLRAVMAASRHSPASSAPVNMSHAPAKACSTDRVLVYTCRVLVYTHIGFWCRDVHRWGSDTQRYPAVYCFQPSHSMASQFACEVSTDCLVGLHMQHDFSVCISAFSGLLLCSPSSHTAAKTQVMLHASGNNTADMHANLCFCPSMTVGAGELGSCQGGFHLVFNVEYLYDLSRCPVNLNILPCNNT